MLVRPSLWGYVWKPMAWAGLFYLLLLVLGQIYLVPWITSMVPARGWLQTAVSVGGGITFTVIWVVAANFLFVAIAALMSSFLWDKLSHQAEEQLFGEAPTGKVSTLGYVVDAVLRFGFAVIIVLLSLLVGWLGIVVGALGAGLLSLVDFTAPAYMRRNVWFPLQLRVLRAPAALGFLLGCGALSLMPFVFLLAIPAMVVGGTILCREAETSPQP